MKRTKYIVSALAFCLPVMVQAQEEKKDSIVERTVVVEQEYTPVIGEASKINLLPKVEQPAAQNKKVEYVYSNSPVSRIPLYSMPIVMGKEKESSWKRFYLRLGAGNKGNIDTHANANLNLSAKDILNITLHYGGNNGKVETQYDDREWKEKLYHGYGQAAYTHQFNQLDLLLGGKISSLNFSYAPNDLRHRDDQKIFSGSGFAGVRSHRGDDRIAYHAIADVRSTSEKDMFNQTLRETLLRLQGGVVAPIADEHFVKVEGTVRSYSYNNKALFDNYAGFDFVSAYLLKSDDWNIEAGANIGFASGYDTKFRIAPDVSVNYTLADDYILFAEAKGGKVYNDFEELYRKCLYGTVNSQQLATFIPLNTRLGIKGSPMEGLHFSVYGGYEKRVNDLVFASDVSLASVIDNDILLYKNLNTHTPYAGAEVSYNVKDIFGVTLSGIYRNWKMDKPDRLLYERFLEYKDNSELNAHLYFCPISPLKLSFDYRWADRQQNVKDINSLSMGVDYQLLDKVHLYAKVNNLLNQKYFQCSHYQVQGINFLGGVSLHL